MLWAWIWGRFLARLEEKHIHVNVKWFRVIVYNTWLVILNSWIQDFKWLCLNKQWMHYNFMTKVLCKGLRIGALEDRSHCVFDNEQYRRGSSVEISKLKFPQRRKAFIRSLSGSDLVYHVKMKSFIIRSHSSLKCDFISRWGCLLGCDTSGGN